MLRTLRPDQQKAIDDLRAAIAHGERRVILQAPTGFGKTVLAGAIIERALERNRRVLFTVPALSLIDQAVEAFRQEGITEVGVIQGQHEMTNWDMPVQVASVQTLMRRKVPKADVVMVDEAHRWFKFYGQWFLHPDWMQIPIIGLSATPWTKGLGAYYNRLIIAGTTEELIESGHLAPFKVYAPSHPDLSNVRTVAGDFHEGDLSEVMGNGGLTADIVDTWLRLGEQRPTFCFAVDRPHAKTLQLKFEERGIPTAYMDAHTPRAEREKIRQRFHDREIKIVCNVGVLTTGIDWDVRCLIMARPTKSEILFVQIVGRVLRTAEGKDYALILDHSDNHLRLGFVTDIHHDRLHDGRTNERTARDGIKLPKECPQCHFLKPPKTANCPACGFVAQAASKTETQPGELQELDRKKTAMRFPDKASTYGMLKQMADSRGYDEGWAAHKFRTIYGVWPNFYKDAPLTQPSDDLISWVRSQQIRWAKSKQNPRNAEVSRAA